MATSKLAKMSTSGRWTGSVQTEISVGDFKPFFIDEPERLGGKNEGPNPLEMVLSSLSGCTSVLIAVVAKEQDFSYSGVAFKNEGALDPRGFMGAEGVTTYFQSIEFDIILETDESDEKMQQLKEAVEKRCPVMNLLVDAGVSVTSNWIKK